MEYIVLLRDDQDLIAYVQAWLAQAGGTLPLEQFDHMLMKRFNCRAYRRCSEPPANANYVVYQLHNGQVSPREPHTHAKVR